MSGEPHELLPQWQPRPATAGRPRGLLDELIEQGVLIKDLAMPGHTFRVTTKIHCDARACLFRCAVTCDGAELAKPPWAPIFRDLAQEMSGRQTDPETRREVARRALEAHLALCTRVGRVLEHGGRLASSGAGARKLLLIGAPALLLAVAGAASWHYWPELRAALATEETPAPPEDAAPPPEGEAEATAEDAPPAAEPEPPAVAPALEPPQPAVEARGSDMSRRPSRRTQAAREERVEPAVETAPAESTPSLGTRAEPPPAPPPRRAWPVTVLGPGVHGLVNLEVGNQVFFGAGIVLVDVPPAYRGLRCVTSRDARGETKQTVAVTLNEPSLVVVAHDRQVKKRPDWLEAFEPTGDTLTATDSRERGGTFTYDLYRKSFPAGPVNLGPNTGASVVGRLGRSVSGRNTLMYLVCVPESP